MSKRKITFSKKALYERFIDKKELAMRLDSHKDMKSIIKNGLPQYTIDRKKRFLWSDVHLLLEGINHEKNKATRSC